MRDYPVLRGHFIYSEAITAIEWLKGCIRNIVYGFVYGDYWMKERVYAARYGLVPIGNLDNAASPGPTPNAMIDTIYARALDCKQHVLWYSDEGTPDLGGHENDDYRAYYQEILENQEIVEKGLYRGGYTVEITMEELALNTVL